MSTLAVNTLTTLTGNTVSLASGKTLDASQGLTTPAGHIVQVQTARGNLTGDVSTSGTSYTEIHSSLRVNFTPKYSDSKIYMEYIITSYGWSTGYIYFEIRADGSALDSTNDANRNKSGSSTEMCGTFPLEVNSWGTTSKVISPYFKGDGTLVYANWGGSSVFKYMRVTEIAQ